MFYFFEARPLFGSPGGKKLLARRIIQFIPDHKKYVEPFCGSAAVFFRKIRSGSEVLSDKNKELVHALKSIRDADDRELNALRLFDYSKSERNFEKAKLTRPKNDRERFWKFMVTTSLSYGGRGEKFVDGKQGEKPFTRFESVRERLKDVEIHALDYQDTIKKFDSSSTLFYLDPPFFGKAWASSGEIDEEEFWTALKRIKGRIILSLDGDSFSRAMKEGFKVNFIRTGKNMTGGTVKDGRSEILSFNFPPRKSETWLVESLREFKVNRYNPKKVTDAQLGDDWRLLVAKYSTMLDGGKTEFKTVKDLLKFADDVFLEILARGKMEFHPKGAKKPYLRFLREMFERNVTEGPYLVAPHAELIHRGKKTAIVKKRTSSYLENFGRLFSDKLTWGWIRTKPPEEVDIKGFEAQEKKHLITPKERETWWPGARKLLLYPIRDFIPLEKPKKVRIPKGVQTFVKNFSFRESTFLPKDWNLQKLSDKDLLRLHAQIHEEAAEFIAKEQKPPPEEIIDQHVIIIEEMRRRKLEHRIFTPLDFYTQRFLKRAGADATKDKLKLSELMELWQDGFKIRRPLLSFIGGTVVSGWGEDIDIHVNWPRWDARFLDALEFRLKSFVPPAWRERIHLVPDESGPFTNYVPFADLVVEICPPSDREVLKMSGRDLREQRIADVKIRKQAEQSRKSDSVVPMRFFTQLKSMKGYRAGEEVEWEKILGWATQLKPSIIRK